MDARIAAALLYRHGFGTNTYREYLDLCTKNPILIPTAMDAFLKGRGKFDAIPMATEAGNLLFEITMDFGAYRDLKRHRRNLFLPALFTALAGHEYPEFVETEPELSEIKQRIDHCAQQTAQLYEKIFRHNQYLAMYIIMFACKQRVVWQMDPRQFAYVVELRTTPAGHHSYRTICQEMFNAAQPHMPEFCKHIRVDLSAGEEGRKKQEEQTVEKLKTLGADTTKVS